MPFRSACKLTPLLQWMLLPHLALARILDSLPLNQSKAVHALVVPS